MQRPGNETISTQIQPSKPKPEITKTTIVKIQSEHMINRATKAAFHHDNMSV